MVELRARVFPAGPLDTGRGRTDLLNHEIRVPLRYSCRQTWRDDAFPLIVVPTDRVSNIATREEIDDFARFSHAIEYPTIVPSLPRSPDLVNVNPSPLSSWKNHSQWCIVQVRHTFAETRILLKTKKKTKNKNRL